ncbi:Transcriptional regulator [Vibrio crassostreae]|nr:Transcriptional regulator [Vibrio crassostreae]CAK2011399.1 Transcriptional regulator [Vibrio crassostreae]CAK2013749.1 Transcriptional regulator [Vibrio crassostreae]CAK2018592.1 Transcriptional regulator [Vibrio crassostreae]CAK2020076.1 Transcriptional regulator [Vibrio crassostreae]
MVRYDIEMNDKSEKLALRLGDILTRLYRGEVLSISWLMEEYGVSEKTLRRDFNQRLVNAPIVKVEDGYRLESQTGSGTITVKRIFDDSGLSSLLPPKHNISTSASTILFKNPRIEDTHKFDGVFTQINSAITSRAIIDLTYQGRLITQVHPYRLVNDRGIWYLSGVASGQLYSYRLAKVSQIQTTEDKYYPAPKVLENIRRVGMEWLTAENADVLLQVDVEVASHFIDGVILPNQQLLKELPDGSLLVSSRVSKLGEIMPILKQWMPRIEVLSPTTLKLELMRELYASLEKL